MPRFTDDQLLIIIRKAARRINRRLCLFGTTSEITIDDTACLVLADGSTDDGALEDLVVLQTECMIINVDINTDFNSSSDSSGNGYLVKDGEQTLDTRGEVGSRVSARVNYLNSENNPCAELEREIVKEKLMRSCDMRDIW